LNSSQTTAKVKIHENLPTFTNWDVTSQDDRLDTIDYIFSGDSLIPQVYENITEFDDNIILASDHRPIISIYERETSNIERYNNFIQLQ
jgi:hypothetical protein